MINTTQITKAKHLLANADAILIGAGAGLSTAAGLNYGGKRFTDNFPDFIKKYGLTDMYSSAFYPFPTKEEFWAYFSRHIKLNRFDAPVGKLYSDLLKLVKEKEHFVITTNADGLFFRAGFDKDKVFATQGDYAKFQCATPCHDTLYDNKEIINRMVSEQKDFRIPTKLLPKCPRCGGDMETNLRKDNTFVEDDNWRAASDRYIAFLKQNIDKKLVMLELGIGFNTPVIIRWPFEQIAQAKENTMLIRVNMDNVESRYPQEERNLLIKGDIKEFIEF